MGNKILVTGGAGFIGSHLTDKLLELGLDVVVLDNLSTGLLSNITKHLARPNFAFVEYDICSPLDELFQKYHFDIVFHLAAAGRVRYSFQEPIKTHQTNVVGTLNLLQSARRFMVKKFIFASSSSVYGFQDRLPLTEGVHPNPASPYGLQKWQGEQYVSWYSKVFNLNAISLRFFNVYGPRQRGDLDHAPLIPKTLLSLESGMSPVIFGKGIHTRDFTYISDIIDGIILSAMEENDSFRGMPVNLGAGKNYSVLEIVNKIIDCRGIEISPSFDPQKTEPSDTLADLCLAKEKLHYFPKIGIDAGLLATVSWYQNYKAV